MSDLTIFSAPKPFTNPHIALIQRNAIRSWLSLGPQVEVILLGNEPGLAETAAELGVKHIPHVACTPGGTPLVSSMFELARQNSTSPQLACVNADILLLP
ncbi:MAG: glycosyl transferase family 2, partial [Anaerolineaceae bacterium]|nr:glycosyl transferase family 2 [Anaerolineaceae bacterium]